MKRIIKLILCFILVFSMVQPVTTKAVQYYGSDIAAEAKKHIGQTYRWGGTGPSSFDCSGFVYYCYKQFGVNITSTTSMYQNNSFTKYGGTYVSISNLMPGDVICFGSSASHITHVGIYVGNGLMVNAANEKYNVCYMYISLEMYYKYNGAITGNVWNASGGIKPLYGVRFLPTSGSSSSSTTFVPNPSPGYLTGNLESATVSGNTVTVGGWAYDGDHIDCRIYMDVYLDDVKIGTGLTDTLRTDVNDAYGLINKHGFNLSFTTTMTGTHTLSVYAMDFDSDDGVLVGSKNITIGTTTTPIIYNPEPGVLKGLLESVDVTDQSINVKGWAYDGDHIDCRIYMDVYVDGEKVYTGLTDTLREDINSTYGLINKHGFDLTFTKELTGTHTIDVYAMDFDSDDGVLVGSKKIEVENSSNSNETVNQAIIGHTDSILITSDQITVSGWLFDPDAKSQSLTYNVYLDGVVIYTGTTKDSRPDVNDIYTLTGNHGFSASIKKSISEGKHVLEIKGVDADTGEEKRVGYEEVTIEAGKELAEIKTVSLVLSGQIGVKFHTEISDSIIGEPGYMEFDIDGKTFTVDLAEAEIDSNGRYVFTCPVNSIEMACTIQATYHYGDEQTNTVNYSVLKYLNAIINHSSNYSDELVSLAKSINDYGYYAQQYFSSAKGWTVGEEHAEMSLIQSIDCNTDLTKYKPTVYSTPIALSVATYSLELDSSVGMKVYINKNTYGVTPVFKVNGKNVKASYDATKNRYCITISNIAAHNLGTNYTISADGYDLVTLSALSYAYAVQNSSGANQNLKNCMVAVYNYYIASMNYRNS